MKRGLVDNEAKKTRGKKKKKGTNERLVRGVNGLYKRCGGEKKERRKRKKQEAFAERARKRRGERGEAESRVKLDKERLPLQRRGKEKEEK